MSSSQVLVVDDEPDIRDLIALTLNRMKIDAQTADGVTQAKSLLAKSEFGLCLSDMRMPDGTGIDLVKHIRVNHPELPVAIITAFGSQETAVEALKAGAFDFISKPVRLEHLRELVNSALKMPPVAKHMVSAALNKPPPTSPKHSKTAQRLIGTSRPMQVLRTLIEKVSRSQAPVHITGESGTGKELVARIIHEKGSRAEGPFVAVNCGAIPSELMESEFFGHKKGSFTGAISDHQGLFEAAHNGTLLLDEVADLPNAMQVKLLRVIQEKSVKPVGSTAEKTVDVRILSATHKDLLELVREGKFREDLYYRINVIELRSPSLRERTDDIQELAEFVLSRLAESQGHNIATLTPDALKALQNYEFSGNVRELENILERAAIMSMDDEIGVEDLNLLDETNAAGNGEDDDAVTSALTGETKLDDYLSKVERQLIEKALLDANNNKTAAAKLLGISFRSLRYKLDKLEID